MHESYVDRPSANPRKRLRLLRPTAHPDEKPTCSDAVRLKFLKGALDPDSTSESDAAGSEQREEESQPNAILLFVFNPTFVRLSWKVVMINNIKAREASITIGGDVSSWCRLSETLQ